jgi:hypothetical protein
MTVFGKYGYLIVDLCTGRLLSNRRVDDYRNLPSTRYDSPGLDLVENLEPAELINSSSRMLSALIHGKDYMKADEGIGIVRCLVAAYESSEADGTPVYPGRVRGLDTQYPWA